MFRWQNILWNIAIWSCCFSFAILNYNKVEQPFLIIPLVILIFLLSILACLIYQKPEKTKTTLLFIGWAIVVIVGLGLQTLALYDADALNIHIFLSTISISFLWCFVGHIERPTEPATFWFIWSLTIVMAISAITFRMDTFGINVVSIGIVFIIHSMYIKRICDIQAPNVHLYKHTFRVVGSAVGSLALLIGNGLFQFKIVTADTWDQIKMGILIAMIIFIFIDAAIGFKYKDDHQYDAVPPNP